jgi:hypothetical protein
VESLCVARTFLPPPCGKGDRPADCRFALFFRFGGEITLFFPADMLNRVKNTLKTTEIALKRLENGKKCGYLQTQ